ncbi:hypothetical protein D3D02_17115 [Halobellus sp. Atlit-38R]|uniref:hypothetical protein n=1 Tax=Halobellus sp. Atlit-38R TaxID=2282131 RepID=UPI000EF1CE56|nr:hypothetical protein [Halobellus sp. Atlit-38R]RLM83723.1 hypothetical protein D3D02_17115 [Halobellus sp. Atlit-38R]
MSRVQEDSRLAYSKRVGERVEGTLIQMIDPLRYVPDTEAEHYDARTEALLTPSADLPFVGICVLEAGTKVEIKSTGVVYGKAQRRGRFKLRKPQHEELLATGGVYLFAVCAPNDDRDVIAAKIIPATLVDELEFSWVTNDRGAPDTQLAWSQLFDVTEIEGSR